MPTQLKLIDLAKTYQSCLRDLSPNQAAAFQESAAGLVVGWESDGYVVDDSFIVGIAIGISMVSVVEDAAPTGALAKALSLLASQPMTPVHVSLLIVLAVAFDYATKNDPGSLA